MKNKVTLTITSKGYKVEAVLDGERYGRHMKQVKGGHYAAQNIDCPDFEQMDQIDDSFVDVLESLLSDASDYADLLNEFEEMDE